MSSVGPKEAQRRRLREQAAILERAYLQMAVVRPTVTEIRAAREGLSVTRGRPKKADALSNTDRQRAFRARKKAAHGR